MGKPASVKSQILRNTLTGWGYKILKIALALFTNPLLIGGLGREGYALITLLATLVGFSELTDLGVRPALGRELAEARTLGRTDEVNRLVSSALAVYAALFCLLGLSLVLATPALARLLGGESASLTHEAVWLIRTYGLFALAVAFTRPAYSAVLASANRFDLRNQAESLFTLLQGVGVIGVLVLTDWGLKGWVCVAIVTQAFNLGQIIFYAHRAQPALRISVRSVHLAEVKRLYSFGALLFASQWAKKLKFDADPILIAHFLSPAAVALYKPANSLMANVRPLLTTFAGQLYPVTTKLFADNDTARIQTLFITASRYTILLAVPVAVFFGFYGQEVMQLWLGQVLEPAEITLAGKVLAGWAIIELAVSLEGAAWAVLFGMRKVKFVIGVELIAAFLNIGSSILLLQTTDLGVLAVILPSIVIEGFIRPVYALYAGHKAKLGILYTLRHVYVRPIGVGVILSGLVLGLRHTILSEGWFWLTLHGCAVGVGFLLLAGLLGITSTERSQIMNLIRKKLGR